MMGEDRAPRILVVGEFNDAIYEQTLCQALRSIGADVFELPIHPLWGSDLMYRVQAKLVLGPSVALANAALLAACVAHRPDVVFAWRCNWLHPATIVAARKLGAGRVVLYNNDDPFGPDRDLRIWRKFRRSIPAADACFAFRALNIEEYLAAGAKRAFLLRSWYNPALHRPISISAEDRTRFGSDVVFIGHCEPDNRLDLLDQLLRTNLHVRVFGVGWGRWKRYTRGRPIDGLQPIEPVLGEDYVRAITAAKVALVFLSTRNRDQYTLRCFEIPAIGAAMLAPRTPELLSMFKEGEEALFFSNGDELVDATRRLVSDDALRTRIAAAGHARCLRDGHDVVSRARGLLRDLATLQGDN